MHKDALLIGIDAGTSIIKSTAFTTDGHQVASSAIPNSYTMLPNGGVEQDMARTWSDTAATLRSLSEKIPRLADRTIAVAVTGQGDGTWLADRQGEPVAPAFLWLDARAASIAEEFTTGPHHADHYGRTGTGVNACQVSIHLAWLHRNRPELLDKAETVFHCKDWLYFKLTGERHTDPSEAVFTFGRYSDRSYAPDILDHLGAGSTKRLLPPILDGTRQCHNLTEAAAKATGLKQGTPIVLGYVDVVCTAAGGGLYDPRGAVGCTIIGSTGMHMRIAPTPADVRLNDRQSGYTMAFPSPGMFAQMQSNMASTINIDWLLDMAIGILKSQGLDRAKSDMLYSIEEAVLSCSAGKLLFHPYISTAGERGPFLNPQARAMFTGLEVGMAFPDLMRAVFEGLCMAARDCYSAMGEIPKEIRVTGGAARSPALRLFLASTLRSNVRTVTRGEAGAAGAAMIAAIQQGIYGGIDECCKTWVTPNLGDITAPDTGLANVYDEAFEQYLNLRSMMSPVWRGLSNIRDRKSPHA